MKKTAFLFSGQGAQYPGMMAEIIEQEPVAQKIFQQADQYLGYPISDLILHGPADKLNETKNTQPALLACEVAALSVLRSKNCEADYYAGFSLGEWAALVAAGVVSFEQGLEIVCKRASFMQEAVPIGKGGMAVILGQSEEAVAAMCDRAGEVTPSNYNCPGQITVAGTTVGIDRLLAIAQENGVVAKRLAISVPSHCELMRPAAVKLSSVLETIPFCNAERPIIMNCTGAPEQQGTAIKKNMIRQLTEPVRFEHSVRYMLSQGVGTFVEIGPGKTLTGLVKKTAKNVGDDVTLVRTDGADLMNDAIASFR